MPLSSPLVVKARNFAERAHTGQVRKSGNVPYFTHLEAVANLLLTHGVTDEVSLATAYLHDVMEDQPQFEPEFLTAFPLDVTESVRCLTEQKRDAAGTLRSKAQRFADYVNTLSGQGDAALRARAVSCADKVHNLQSLVDAQRGGDDLLLRLRTRPGEHAPQLAQLEPLYRESVPASLFRAFVQAREELLSTIQAWLPGRAVHIAAEAHLGQFDRAGQPYIYHPMHLAVRAATEAERTVAILHDVIEDTPWDLPQLKREGFSEEILVALDALTRRAEESYEAFIERISGNPLASRVKLLDLEHNSDLSRLESPTDEDRARAQKYRRSIETLRRSLA